MRIATLPCVVPFQQRGVSLWSGRVGYQKGSIHLRTDMPRLHANTP